MEVRVVDGKEQLFNEQRTMWSQDGEHIMFRGWAVVFDLQGVPTEREIYSHKPIPESIEWISKTTLMATSTLSAKTARKWMNMAIDYLT